MSISFGQSDTLALSVCMKAARENAVLQPQFSTYSDINSLKTANATASGLPSLAAYGIAWYQSDAVSVSMTGGMGIDIDPFQYNTGLQLDQKLFDGRIAYKTRNMGNMTMRTTTSRIGIQTSLRRGPLWRGPEL